MNKDSFNMGEISRYRTPLFAIAIILVVFHHLTFKYESGILGQAYSFFRVTGAFGVDIFLFLSGLGCHYSFSKNENIIEFYKRRFMRILPAYLIVAIPAYFVTDILIAKEGILTYLSDVTLISFWIKGGSDWYIAASIILYLLFPIIYKSISKVKTGFFILLGEWAIVSLAVYCIDHSYFAATSRLWARIPAFILGAVIAPKIQAGFEISYWNRKLVIAVMIHLVSLLAEAFLALKGREYAYSFTARLIYCPLAISAVFILSWFFSKIKMSATKGILVFLGGITLEIYMLNQRVIDLCTYYGKKLMGGRTLSILLSNLIGVGVTVILSVFLHKAIEKVQKRNVIKKQSKCKL